MFKFITHDTLQHEAGFLLSIKNNEIILDLNYLDVFINWALTQPGMTYPDIIETLPDLLTKIQEDVEVFIKDQHHLTHLH